MIIRVLDWLGRRATTALAAGVLIGLVVPPLATLLRPLLVVFIILPLAIALTRIEWRDLWRFGRRWPLVLALVAWMIVASPILTYWSLAWTALPPALIAGIVLMAAAPPIVSAAAIALFLGLDAAIIIVVTVASMWLVPFVLPPMALLLLGLEIDISLVEFMARLAALVVVAFALAAVAKRWIGRERLATLARPLDGAAVLSMLFFVVAIMDGITALILDRPGYALLVTAMGFVYNLGLQVAGAGLFWGLGRRMALSVGLMSGNCNMGMVLVVLADRADFDTVAFFALAQIPMFMLPALLLPLYRRLVKVDPRAAPDNAT